MRRLNIGIDVDDVLADFTHRFLGICRARFGKPAPGYMSSDWEWSNSGLLQVQINETWEVIKSIPNFWESLRPVRGVDQFSLLPLEQHKLFFITARVPTVGAPVEVQTARWIRRYLSIEFPTVLVTSDKGPLAKALQLDYFIDDRDKNIREVFCATECQCQCFVKNASHNQDFRWSRVADVNDFATQIQHQEKVIASTY